MDFEKIIGQLSEEELDDLSRKIEESRKQRSELVTYEVSFKVTFWPFAHQDERICSLSDFRSDISNELPRLIEDWFNLPDKPEGFSDLRVRKLEDSDEDLSQSIKGIRQASNRLI